MSEAERVEWDRRYASGDYRPRSWPSPFLEGWLERFPVGKALEVACGAGRNALRLAEAGFEVEAVDISQVALDMGRAGAAQRGLELVWRVADLDDLDLPVATYDLITVIRYMNRGLWPRLIEALAPGGWLLIEHHLKSHAKVVGPSTPEFRLEPQELLEAFKSLRIVFYEEVVETGPENQPYALERLVAVKGDPGF